MPKKNTLSLSLYHLSLSLPLRLSLQGFRSVWPPGDCVGAVCIVRLHQTGERGKATICESFFSNWRRHAALSLSAKQLASFTHGLDYTVRQRMLNVMVKSVRKNIHLHVQVYLPRTEFCFAFC